MKKILYIIGLTASIVSPFFVESNNKFYPLLGVVFGLLLIYVSKDKEGRNKELKIMKFVILLTLGVVITIYMLAALWFYYEYDKWLFKDLF